MSRTILVHLNVEPNPADERSPDEIADAILTALGVGPKEFTRMNYAAREPHMTITCPMAEEI